MGGGGLFVLHEQYTGFRRYVEQQRFLMMFITNLKASTSRTSFL